MPTFTLKFAGLVLHFDRAANGKRAVLVDDHPNHVPVLIIPAAAGPTGTWTGTPKGSNVEYDLQKSRVTITDIATGKVTEDASFTKGVPSLKAIRPENSVDEPYAEIEAGTLLANKITAFIDYSAGTISADECFESEMVFDPAISGDPRCIAKIITFVGTTTTGTKVRINNNETGKYIEIPDNTEIRILNTSSGGGMHHKEYKKLMKNNTEPRGIVRTVRACGTCTPVAAPFLTINDAQLGALITLFSKFPELGKYLTPFIGDLRGIYIIGVRSVSVECSNSAWP